MASIIQDYSPIGSLQKMVDDVPSNNKKKHKKRKKERMETTLLVVPQTIQQLQKTPVSAPNELLTEMGFDLSPSTSSSNSSGSPTAISVMDEKNLILTRVFFTITA